MRIRRNLGVARAPKVACPAAQQCQQISALIADRMGFKALYVTGYGVVASALGLPDAGLATYTEMIDRIGRIAEMTKTPIIADADTGYGGLLNVRHTVRGYEKAGVTAIESRIRSFQRNVVTHQTGASSQSKT
jgi:2-methylisocitrate lyase-like PEP mutase family enzyme